MENFKFTPIGTVRCAARYRFEAPRQGVFHGSDGIIELLPEYGGDAVADIAGFERIWVIFCFHLNQGHPWKAKVQPPLPASGVCRSLFATRSPYRVNPIGLSCVRVTNVERNKIYISESDMLDGTPVLDIKPYIPAADAFPDATAGWLDEAQEKPWQVVPDAEFIRHAEFISKISGLDILHFCEVQLGNAPLDFSRKRITAVNGGACFALGCRTWRAIYSCNERDNRVLLHRIESNYFACELTPGADDRYGDKEFHRRFIAEFGA